MLPIMTTADPAPLELPDDDRALRRRRWSRRIRWAIQLAWIGLFLLVLKWCGVFDPSYVQ